MAVLNRKGIWYVDYWPNGRYGKRVRLRCPDGCSETEAYLIEQDIKSSLKSAKKDVPDISAVMTMAEVFDLYYTYIRANRSTWTISSLKSILPILEKTMGAVTVEEYHEGYVNMHKIRRKAAGMKPSSINTELTVLKAATNWARKRGVPLPQVHIEMLAAPRPIPTVLTQQEVSNLLRVSPPFHRALFGLMYFCGMRKGEARLAKWEDCDYQNKTIIVPQGKGSKSRSLPLPPIQISFLEAIHTSNSGYIFVTKYTGKPITSVLKMMKKYALLAGITKNVYPHLLRHSVATHLLAASGTNIRTIQMFLGHSQVGITEWYTHVTSSHLQFASESISESFKALSTAEASP